MYQNNCLKNFTAKGTNKQITEPYKQ